MAANLNSSYLFYLSYTLSFFLSLAEIFSSLRSLSKSLFDFSFIHTYFFLNSNRRLWIITFRLVYSLERLSRYPPLVINVISSLGVASTTRSIWLSITYVVDACIWYQVEKEYKILIVDSWYKFRSIILKIGLILVFFGIYNLYATYLFYIDI